ncbi:formate/nitrite transporter family protein [Clostridium tagluense]|uniref:formate/nitrite transporter family protein n=1 Tax=Clostridium tagluense TaxID=360422 RepID=UPI001C0CE036|nr:formate/nitrite transporter family protein [Clostridium tagluense]MBU3127285.1 formate/nitrite transporter family protein [Clostridium tagluense]MCB2311241.1 formate/nitrite transporter family protein [Clostridium tagluense]MCB2315965.1 formate/nitrite transporter family protein [Clostridium tagluense]MCB2320688.1 formate/nitrite transporter family protein [Clostridium tagluense]MCB2325705.1 formate/nitrite transporter family protein [Clostridium tagluense]
MDKSMLSTKEVCNYVESLGIQKANNKFIQTLILGILAGAFIAIGGFSAAMASHSIENVGVAKLVSGIIFPVGLMLVIICGAELFTGNCLLTVAYAQKKITLKKMLKNWAIVYFANFIGAFIIVVLIYYSGLLSTSGGKFGGYVIKVAAYKCGLTVSQAFTSGILCNFVVSLAVWGSYAAKDVVSKVFISFFPIMAFVIAGFEHSVANMYYLLLGLFAKVNPDYVQLSHQSAEKVANINFVHIAQNLIPTTLGNIVGGGIFVGLAYWLIFNKAVLKDVDR